MNELKKVILGLEIVLCIFAVAVLRSWFPVWQFDGAVLLLALLVGWLFGKQNQDKKRGKETEARMKGRYVTVLLLLPIAAAVIVYCLKVMELATAA
ncbi:MAG: hypothetical protein E7223_07430 [Clostridiales bacterium]|nr:hypothetical protein [Clostridiales bacterium]